MKVKCERCNKVSWRVISGQGIYCADCANALTPTTESEIARLIGEPIAPPREIPRILDFANIASPEFYNQITDMAQRMDRVVEESLFGTDTAGNNFTINWNRELLERSGVSISQIGREIFQDDVTLPHNIFLQRIEEYHKKHPEYFECLEIMHKKAYPKE